MYDWDIAWWEIGVRLMIAGAGAAPLGWDRERTRRPAGLRTHILVALGAAGFTLIACELFATLEATGVNERADPIRIIAAIVGGIGFLGAGAIIQSGGEVRGLTTAAGLWVAAAIGMAAGLGFYGITIMIAALCFITLRILRDVSHQIEQDGEADDAT